MKRERERGQARAKIEVAPSRGGGHTKKVVNPAKIKVRTKVAGKNWTAGSVQNCPEGRRAHFQWLLCRSSDQTVQQTAQHRSLPSFLPSCLPFIISHPDSHNIEKVDYDVLD